MDLQFETAFWRRIFDDHLMLISNRLYPEEVELKQMADGLRQTLAQVNQNNFLSVLTSG